MGEQLNTFFSFPLKSLTYSKMKKKPTYILNIWELSFIPICRNNWETRIRCFHKNLFVSFPDFSRKGCVWAPGCQLRTQKLNFQCVTAAQPGQELHLGRICTLRPFPKHHSRPWATILTRKGKQKPETPQFQDHFPKAEAAATFWSETSIAGACPRKKCNKYASNV